MHPLVLEEGWISKEVVICKGMWGVALWCGGLLSLAKVVKDLRMSKCLVVE